MSETIQNLRRDFQGKPQSTKPRSPLKTIAKWTAIAVATPVVLFVGSAVIAGVYQAFTDPSPVVAQAASPAPEAQKQQKTAQPVQKQYDPASTVTQASAVVKQRGGMDRYNVQPAPICDSLNALDSYKALQHSGRWETAMQMTSCITLPEQTDVIYVRSMGDYVRVIWTLRDGTTREGWVSDYDFAMQSIHDLRACKDRECRKALGVDG